MLLVLDDRVLAPLAEACEPGRGIQSLAILARVRGALVDLAELGVPVGDWHSLRLRDALHRERADVVLDVLRPARQLGWVLQERVYQHCLGLLLQVLAYLKRKSIRSLMRDIKLHINSGNSWPLSLLRGARLLHHGCFHLKFGLLRWRYSWPNFRWSARELAENHAGFWDGVS